MFFLYFYYTIFFIVLAILFGIFIYIQYRIYYVLQQLRFMVFITPLPFLFIFFVLSYYIYTDGDEDYFYEEFLLIALLWYTNIYYLNTLYIMQRLRSRHIMDGMVWFGHTQVWYFFSLFCIDWCEDFFIGFDWLAYWYSSPEEGWEDYGMVLVLLLVIYHFACWFLVSKMTRECQWFWLVLHWVAFISFVNFYMFVPIVPSYGNYF